MKKLLLFILSFALYTNISSMRRGTRRGAPTGPARITASRTRGKKALAEMKRRGISLQQLHELAQDVQSQIAYLKSVTRPQFAEELEVELAKVLSSRGTDQMPTKPVGPAPKPTPTPSDKKEPATKEKVSPIRTFMYDNKAHILDLSDLETFTQESYQELLDQGKRLVAVVSNGYVHFYDKDNYNMYRRAGKDTDPKTRLPIKDSFDVKLTDKEILKISK